MTRIGIAAAQYPLDRFDRFQSFEDKLSAWVAEAAGAGAELLVFPEYGSLELASLFGPPVEQDVQATFDRLTTLLPQVDALHAALAMRHGVHILAASAAIRRDGL